jgi:hypothetical protein
LKRWLRSNVGRPWNDVFSEACQVFKADNVVRAHIRTHMMEYVERHTFMSDGEVWCVQRSIEVPIRSLRGHTVWPKFYVHPETGILHEVPHARLVDPQRAMSACRDEIRKWISPEVLLLKIHYIWYSLEMRRVDEAPETPAFDALFRFRLCKSHAYDAYGKAAYCARKRQLSRAELKLYCLVNSATPSGIHAMLGADAIERMKRSNGLPPNNHFRRVDDIGLSVITTWSRVRVQPSAQHAEVAQW